MKLNIKKIKLYTKDELYSVLLPIIDKIYKSYNYLNIPMEEYKEYVMNILEKCQNEVDDEKLAVFDIYFSEELKKYTNKILLKLLKDDDNFVTITSNYISLRFSSKLAYNDILNQLNNMANYFDNIGVVFYPEQCINIINNNEIVNKSLKVIVNKNLFYIRNGKANEVFDNNNLLSLIETYCMLNNISIGEKNITIDDELYNKFLSKDDKCDDNDYYEEDTLKTYLRQVKNEGELLSTDEECMLFRNYANGDLKAREIIINKNLALVISIASKYRNLGLSFLDLIQSGNEGLIISVDRFDVKVGYRFSTYASQWIRAKIKENLACLGKSMSLSVYDYCELNKYRTLFTKLEIENGREPTVEEMANILGMSKEKVMNFRILLDDSVCINMLIPDSEHELGELLPDLSENVEEKNIDFDLERKISSFIEKSNLSQREQKALMLRYGLGENESHKLDELASKLSVSYQRIQQILDKAMFKLINYKEIAEFNIYMDNPDEALENLGSIREKYRLKYDKELEKSKKRQKKTKEKKLVKT